MHSFCFIKNLLIRTLRKWAKWANIILEHPQAQPIVRVLIKKSVFGVICVEKDFHGVEEGENAKMLGY